MPTYIYETIPLDTDTAVERFEVKQRFGDAALTVHPTSGVSVRRVISGGIGMMTKSNNAAAQPEPGPGCGPETCRCGRFD